MSWLTCFALYVFHAIYYLTNVVSSIRRSFAGQPQELTAERRLIPKHLALVLATDHETPLEVLEKDMVENVVLAVSWCRTVGITRLTVYDRGGVLSGQSLDIRERLVARSDASLSDSSVESEIEYPLTPPLSDDSDSRSLSPDQDPSPTLHVSTISLSRQLEVPKKRRTGGRNVVKRRRPQPKESTSSATPFTLHILSRRSGKPAIADVANHFLRSQRQTSRTSPNDFSCSISDITCLLEGEDGFSSPDLMIVHEMSSFSHPQTLELHGFPPWQIRLTEFHHNQSQSWRWPFREKDHGQNTTLRLDDIEFRRALDEFAAAEMRLGK